MAPLPHQNDPKAPAGPVAVELARARAGDVAALEAVLRRVQPQLEAHVANALGTRLRASTRESDIVQDAMLEVVRRIGEFEGHTEATFVRWVERIVETGVRQQHRFLSARKRRPPSQPPAQHDLARAILAAPRTPSSFAIQAENLEEYARALAELGEDQRHVIEQVVVAGRPVDEVATEMARTPTAVHSLLSRARAALALRLGQNRPPA